MALVLADRVRDTTTTTGTGTVTLSGTAPTGYQNFSVIGNTNTTYYTINAGSEWEVGIGTYSSTGPTLARTTVLASSNAGALVNFSAGTKDVFVTYPAGKSVYQDASGNVGIGVAAPAEKLQVSDGILARYQYLYESMIIGAGQNNVNYIEIGSGRTGNNLAYIDLVTDSTTYTDYGTRLFRDGGVNGVTTLYHRGTGELSFQTQEAAPIGFYTSGTVKMSITASGNVGINTTDPTTLLQIGNIGATDATYQGRIKLEDNSSSLQTVGGLEFTTSAFGSGYGWKINSIDTAGSGVHLLFGTRQNSTTWVETLRLAENGYVGILTAGNPTRPLDVRGNIIATNGTNSVEIGSTDGNIELVNTSGNAYIDFKSGSAEDFDCRVLQASNGLSFFVGGNGTASERMTISSGGNVGIGATLPTYTLDVTTTSTNVAEFVSTDAGATAGPVVYYYRNSASPANADIGPQLNMNGNSSTGVQRTYAAIITDFDTVTNAAEVGSLRFAVSKAGTLTSVLDINGPAGTIELTGTTGLQIQRTAVTAPAAGDGNVFSGTYTPSLSNTTNIASSTAAQCQYMRVGNVVTVSGEVTIDPTATGRIVMGMTLPITSALTNARQVGGTFAAAGSTSVNVGSVSGDATNDRATFDGVVADTNSRSYYFTFTYLVV